MAKKEQIKLQVGSEQVLVYVSAHIAQSELIIASLQRVCPDLRVSYECPASMELTEWGSKNAETTTTSATTTAVVFIVYLARDSMANQMYQVRQRL
jgi:hypothetical protein